MKKIILLLLSLYLLICCVACSNEEKPEPSQQTTTTTSTNQIEIEDVFFEKDIEKLKKSFPDYLTGESENKQYLILNSKLGDIDGEFTYTISDETIIERKFLFTLPFYKNIDSLSEFNSISQWPAPDAAPELKSTISKLYNIVTEEYNFTNMDVIKEHRTNGTESFDGIKTYEDFEEHLSPLFDGPHSEYSTFKFCGYADNSANFFTVTFLNYKSYVEVKIVVQ